MLTSRMFRTLIASAAMTAAVACGTSEVPSTGPALSEVETPAGFTFATSRSVSVGLTADDSVFGDKKDLAIEVSEPDGATVFQGALRKGKTLDLKLPMGVHVDSINARVTTPGGGSKFYNLPIDANTQSIDGQLR